MLDLFRSVSIMVAKRVRSDLRRDRSLRYILVIAAILSSFWFWYRVPNFASADEYSRLIYPMKVAGSVVSNPSFDSFRIAILDGRALGATFYLYGFALFPLFCLVLLLGLLGEFASLGNITSRWTLWHETPSWFWTGSILLGRCMAIAFAIGSVYITYRLGSQIRDRRTGRYASILLSVSFGFISMSHEIGEDIPMLFFLLLSTYCALRFIQTGNDWLYLAGASFGGVAIAFKLSAGVTVFVIGSAILLRKVSHEGPKSTIVRPKLIGYGIILGFLSIYVGMPSVLVGGPDVLLRRALDTTGAKTTSSGGRSASIWLWMAKGYLNGLGLPLFVAVLLGSPFSLLVTYRERANYNGIILLLIALIPFFVVFTRWQYIRMHHLLPTLPLLLLLLGVSLSYLVDRYRKVGRIFLISLVLLTFIYAGMGVVEYAHEPRDQASEWMESNVEKQEDVEVYENSIADVAAVHGMPLRHYPYQEENATYSSTLVLNESAYTEWMTSSSERKPEYIQLTSEELRYLDPHSPRSDEYPRRAAYIRTLVQEEGEYRIVAEFGERPQYNSPREELIWAGINPNPSQKESYVVILERKD